MEQKEQEKRKLKFLMIMPLLTIPFIIVLFYSFGGGKSKEPIGSKQQGLNKTIPSAQLDKSNPLDKLSIYNNADRDSLARANEIAKDPYLTLKDTFRNSGDIRSPYNVNNDVKRLAGIAPNDADPNEEKVKRKLAELEKQLNAGTPEPANYYARRDTQKSLPSGDIQRLEKLLSQPINAGSEPDSDIAQLNNLLDKVLDVQHPERVKERLKTISENQKGKTASVQLSAGDNITDLMQPSGNPSLLYQPNRFYELEDDNTHDSIASNAIAAVVHETQTLVSGATVKLRLQQDIYLQGTLIPAGTFLFGTCALNGERLTIQIENIRYKNALFPVGFTVYDLDGLPGIRIAGAISRDVARQSADGAIQGLGLTTYDPSLGAQAASAGIETVKNFLNKKVRLIKVTLKAGHPVLLKSSNS